MFDRVRPIFIEPHTIRHVDKKGNLMIAQVRDGPNELKRKPTFERFSDSFEPPNKKLCNHQFNSIICMRVNLEYEDLPIDEELVRNRPIIQAEENVDLLEPWYEEDWHPFDVVGEWFSNDESDFYDYWVSEDEDWTNDDENSVSDDEVEFQPEPVFNIDENAHFGSFTPPDTPPSSYAGDSLSEDVFGLGFPDFGLPDSDFSDQDN